MSDYDALFQSIKGISADPVQLADSMTQPAPYPPVPTGQGATP